MKAFVFVLALFAVAYATKEGTTAQSKSEGNELEKLFHKAKEYAETKGPEIAKELGEKFQEFKHYLDEKLSEGEHDKESHGSTTTESSSSSTSASS